MPLADKSVVSDTNSNVLDNLYDVPGVGPVPGQVPNVVQSVGQNIATWAATPGNVLQGQEPQVPGQWSDVDEATAQANMAHQYQWGPETALGMMGGATPFAEADALGIFGGRMAKTANQEALQRAIALDRQGMTKDVIFDATGWFRGWDGKWRFEIPDRAMKVADPGLEPSAMLQGPAGKLIEHPELFKAYPELAKIHTIVREGEHGGSYWPASANDRAGIMTSTGTHLKPSILRQTTGHELQHAVQNIEGFDVGSSPERAASKAYQEQVAGKAGKADPQDLYRRASGEVEARNVSKRIDMDAARRRQVQPWKTQDIPYKQQVPSPARSAASKDASLSVPQHAVQEGRAALTKTQEPEALVNFAAKHNLSNDAIKEFIDDNYSSPKYRAKVYEEFLKQKKTIGSVIATLVASGALSPRQAQAGEVVPYSTLQEARAKKPLSPQDVYARFTRDTLSRALGGTENVLPIKPGD